MVSNIKIGVSVFDHGQMVWRREGDKDEAQNLINESLKWIKIYEEANLNYEKNKED